MTDALLAPERQRIDADAVAAAALTLAARGQLISATAVHRELGRGSLVTVTKHLKAWAGEAMPLLAGKVTAPRWTARELEGMALLRRVFREEAAQALAEDRSRAKAEVETAQTAAATASAQAQAADAARLRAEERADGLQSGLNSLNEQLATAARDRESLNAQIERLQAANTEAAKQYEQTVGDLRQQIADAITRYRDMEKHMLVEIDRARVERDRLKSKFEDDLRLANARSARDATELDRVRKLRDEAENNGKRLELALEQATTGRVDAERRLQIAEGQVQTLIQKTGELATAQGELGTRLLAAQQRSETLGDQHQQLRTAAAALAKAASGMAKEPPDPPLQRLLAAAAATQELLAKN